PPELPRAVDAEVLRKAPLTLDLQFGVPPRTGRTLAAVDPLGDMRMVGRRGDRQHLADRLDPIRFPVIIDERDHGFTRRSSSAWQNMLTPCEESRSPVEVRGSRAPRPSASRPYRSERPPSRVGASGKPGAVHWEQKCVPHTLFLQ